MYKYFEPLTNRSGDSLPGYFARLFDAGGNQVDIFADNSGTPIVTVSDVANAAKSDENGMFRWYVTNGTYDIRFYDSNDVFKSAEVGVPMFEASGVYTDLSADDGATRVGTPTGTVQADLAARPTSAALIAADGSEKIGFAAGITSSATRPSNEKLDEGRSWLDGVTSAVDRAAILAKTDTTDRASTINTKFTQNRQMAGRTMTALGRVFVDSAILVDQSMTIAGEAGRKHMDNSADLDNAGTQILGRSLTDDVLRFDSTLRGDNGRLFPCLTNLLVVGNRLDHDNYANVTAATTGNGITFKGGPDPEDGTQQLSVTTHNLSVVQARLHNIELRDNTYGSSLINTQIDRAGSCGIFADDGGEGGETYFGGVTRAFQNGHDTGLADTLRAGVHISLGSWGADMLSCSESRGCNSVLGGIFNIAVYQSESGALGIAGSVGRQTALIGAIRAEMPAVNIAPGAGYDGAVIHLDATSRNVRIGGLINADALGANGRHIEIENGFECLDVSMLTGVTSVKDKRTANFETKTGGFVLARNTGAGTATGGGATVQLALTELVDTRQRFASDVYQTLFGEQLLIVGNLTFENIASGHTAGMIYVEVEEGGGWTSTGNYGREIPFNPYATRNTTTNSCSVGINVPIVLRGANSDRTAGEREGAKVRIRYQITGGADAVTLVTAQSYISFTVV